MEFTCFLLIVYVTWSGSKIIRNLPSSTYSKHAFSVIYLCLFYPIYKTVGQIGNYWKYTQLYVAVDLVTACDMKDIIENTAGEILEQEGKRMLKK